VVVAVALAGVVAVTVVIDAVGRRHPTPAERIGGLAVLGLLIGDARQGRRVAGQPELAGGQQDEQHDGRGGEPARHRGVLRGGLRSRGGCDVIG